MIELIDQSNPEKLVFRCSLCNRTFTQRDHAQLDLHRPEVGAAAAKLGIPPCQPLAAPPNKAATK